MAKNLWKHPFFKKHVVRRFFGTQLALASVVFSVVVPTHAFDYSVAVSEPTTTAEQAVTVQTPAPYCFPLAITQGISQFFSAVHPGVDLMAPRGTAILSMESGTVVEVGHLTTGYGNYVRVAHAGLISTLYAHMERVEARVGQVVSCGEEIGQVGTTGWSTGPHLHFEVHEGLVAVNPLKYISENK